MLDWIAAALAAFSIYGAINIIDKLLRHEMKSPMSLVLLMAASESLIILLALFYGLEFPELPILLLGIAAGIAGPVAFIPYLEALYAEEVSRVIPLFNLMPVFVLILSHLFLGEVLTTVQYAAFVLILLGSILISLKDGRGFFSVNSKVLLLMCVSSLIYALQLVFSKVLLMNVEFVHGLVLIGMGYLISACFLLANGKIRTDAFRDFSMSRRHLVVLFTLFSIIGGILFYYSVMHGIPSLVSVLSGFQMVAVLAFATAISLWYPAILKEEVTPRNMALKIVSIALMLAGLALLYL